MSAAAFTPGPWRVLVVRGDGSGASEIWAGSSTIRVANCSVSRSIGRPVQRANARLMAAAPALLEKLEACCDALDIVDFELDNATRILRADARAAIAEAKGDL